MFIKGLFLLLLIVQVFASYAQSALIYTMSPRAINFGFDEVISYSIIEKVGSDVVISYCYTSYVDVKELKNNGYVEVSNTSEWFENYPCTENDLRSVKLNLSQLQEDLEYTKMEKAGKLFSSFSFSGIKYIGGRPVPTSSPSKSPRTDEHRNQLRRDLEKLSQTNEVIVDYRREHELNPFNSKKLLELIED